MGVWKRLGRCHDYLQDLSSFKTQLVISSRFEIILGNGLHDSARTPACVFTNGKKTSRSSFFFFWSPEFISSGQIKETMSRLYKHKHRSKTRVSAAPGVSPPVSRLSSAIGLHTGPGEAPANKPNTHQSTPPQTLLFYNGAENPQSIRIAQWTAPTTRAVLNNPALLIKRKEKRMFDVSRNQPRRTITAERPIREPRTDRLPNNEAENPIGIILLATRGQTLDQ